jgi:tetratricopeptide (TPR) repeat protein
MAIDREAVLRTAERLLRQGKLEAAIAEYVRLTEDQPRDWNSINTLGDLYVRAGNIDRAIVQFVRIADHLFDEGFLPKAAALYKKALKVKQDHEHTLFRLSDIAVKQELFADAKLYLRQLAQQRQGRGDHRGAAECVLRLGEIDENDGDAKVAAAQAARGIGDTARAVAMLQEAATAYEKQKRPADAANALVAAAELSPDDHDLRAVIARALVAAGHMDRAQPFLTASTIGEDPDLLLAVARQDLTAGRMVEASAALMRVVAMAPDRAGHVSQLADELLAGDRVEEAYACVDVLVDAALFEAAFERAAEILHAFLERRRIVPGLLKLVDVYVDAGLDDRITAVQEQLADAYLDSGQAAEARVVAEDLVARAPHVDQNVQRLRRALIALGVDNVDEVIAHQLDVAPIFHDPIELSTFESTPVADEPSRVLDGVPEAPTADAEEPFTFDAPAAVPEPLPEPEVRRPQAHEIDLSAMLTGMNPSARASLSLPPTAASAGPTDGNPSALLDKAQEFLRRGADADAAAALMAAVKVPQLRFKAAVQLARLSASSGDSKGTIEWLERAASAPASSPDETFGVLYDLADALERAGEDARALAVFMELEADAGSYRNVRVRIDQLAARNIGMNGERK